MHELTAWVTRDQRLADRTVAPRRSESAALEAAVEGRYSLERELGRGATAVVYLARDLVLDRQVAIKALRELADVPRLRARFLEEARTVAGLVHSHVVPVYTVEYVRDVAFFVMPYVAGETLAHRVQRAGPVGCAAALRIMRSLAGALAYAHDRGVVHRDVKPENIVLEHATDRAMLLDFGISVRLRQGQPCVTDALVGTPNFMSPEQASGAAVDARSDLYSLGATMFFALAGRPPFDAVSVNELPNQLRTAPVPPLGAVRPDLPQQLGVAVERCLAKAPLDRFPTARHLLATLTPRGAGCGVRGAGGASG